MNIAKELRKRYGSAYKHDFDGHTYKITKHDYTAYAIIFGAAVGSALTFLGIWLARYL